MESKLENPTRVLRRFASHREQEEATRLYWRDRSVAEKMEETASLTRYAYGLRGIDVDAQGLARTVVRLQRARS